MNFLHEQLPLAVQLRDDATFDNFFAGSNGLVLSELRRQLDGGEFYLYLFGSDGSGRSHLLQAACHQAGKRGLAALYLPLDELQAYNPAEMFDGLLNLSLVCIDNIESVMGKPEWEEALFHFFNQMKDAGNHLLIAGNCAVRELKTKLPDLASRLSWGLVYQLQSLSDEELIQVLQLRAVQRGLELSEDVSHFILHRCQRDMSALMATLDTLDHASLKQRRRLTIPFIKSILNC